MLLDIELRDSLSLREIVSNLFKYEDCSSTEQSKFSFNQYLSYEFNSLAVFPLKSS